MAKTKKSAEAPVPRLESVLAYMAVGVIAFSILIIGVLLVAYATGVTTLPTLLPLLPFIGLPIGMLLIIALVIVGVIRRSKEANNTK
jgi:ABC-type multidrug transport system permease subunit